MKKKEKKLVSMLLVAVLVLAMIPLSAGAAEIIASGNCGAEGATITEPGNNVKWKLDENGVLTIYGKGRMKDYYDYPNYMYYGNPWCMVD